MASLETLIANVAKIAGFVKVYLKVPVLSPSQKAALKKNLAQLDKNLAALVAYTPPPPVVVPLTVPAVKAAVAPPPNFGESDAMSSGLYADWMSKWVVARFPAAYANWPPEVGSITPEALHDAAVEDGCLAQVTACGNFSTPDGVWAALGDFSLYTALTSTMDDAGLTHRVWHMGKLVGTQSGGDGLDFAHSLGFNW